MINWDAKSVRSFYSSDMFKKIIHTFYEIYWRVPTTTEFFEMGFINKRWQRTYQTVYRNALEDLGYDVRCGTWTCVLYNDDDDIAFIGGCHDIASELDTSVQNLYRAVSNSVNYNAGVMYRGKKYRASIMKYDKKNWVETLKEKCGINIMDYDGGKFAF